MILRVLEAWELGNRGLYRKYWAYKKSSKFQNFILVPGIQKTIYSIFPKKIYEKKWARNLEASSETPWKPRVRRPGPKGPLNLILVPRRPGRVFGGPGTEKSDFEEIGVASPELEPAPREERERRAGSFEGSQKPLTQKQIFQFTHFYEGTKSPVGATKGGS